MKNKITIVLFFAVIGIIAVQAGISSTKQTLKVHSSSGRYNASGKAGSTPCGSCHGNNGGTTTSLTATTNVALNSSYTETITISDATRRYVGFNIAVNDNTKALIVPVSSGMSADYNTGSSTYNEITHNNKFDKGASFNADQTFDFKVIPIGTSASTFTVYYNGLSADGTGGTGGDAWQLGSKTFTTTGSFPTGTSFIPSDNAIASTFFRPIGMASAYSRQASIYTASEIGGYGLLSKIGYFVTQESSVGGNIQIYVKKTTATSFSSNNTFNTEISGATLVYSGYTYTWNAGWTMFNLQTAFNYDANNLEIIFVNNRGGSATTDTKTCAQNTSTNNSHYWDTNNDGVTQSATSSSRPNVRIQQFGTPSNMIAGTTTISTIPLSWTEAIGADAYRLVIKEGSVAPTSITDGVATDIPSGSSYIVTGLGMNTNYSFALYTISGSIYASTGTSITNITTANKTTIEFSYAQPASMLFGQTVFETGTNANKGNANPSTTSMSYPEGIFVSNNYNSDDKVFVADGNNNRILIYNTPPTSSSTPANVIIGQSSATTATSGATQNKLHFPVDVAYTSIGNFNYLFIVDQQNNRVIIHNSVPTTSGTYVTQNAWKVFGQPNFTTVTAGTTAAKLSSPTAILIVGTKMLISDGNNNRVLIWNDFTTAASGANADVVIGQSNFTTNSTTGANQGSNNSDSQSLIYPWGLAVSDAGKLYVASRLEHRVLVYDSIPTTNYIAASLVLGQNNFSDNSFNFTPSASNMGFVRDIAISSRGSSYERLAVLDYSNNRISVWNTLPTTTNQSPDVCLGMESLTIATLANASTPTNAVNTYGSEYFYWANSGNLYVSQTSSNRVLRFDGGNGNLSGPTSFTLTNTTANSATFTWSGGNATQYRIVYKTNSSSSVNNENDGAIIDNLTGSSTTVSGLNCNTSYSFAIYGKSNYKALYAANTSGVAVNTLSGTNCSQVYPNLGDGETVYSMANFGNILYMGGNFTQVGGMSRSALAAINATTGEVLNWSPTVMNGTNVGFVGSLKVSSDGNYVYVGGIFDQINGSTVYGIAKISTSTGLVVSYPQLNAAGNISGMTLAPDNSLFFIGNFTNVGSQSGYAFATNPIAGIDGNGNVISTFQPYFNNVNAFRSMAVSANGNYLYIGHGNAAGTYMNMGQTNFVSRGGIVELEVATGDATAFNPSPNTHGVFDIATENNNALYIAGSFSQIDNFSNAPRRNLAKFTGGAGSWILDATFAPTSTANGPNALFTLGTGGVELRGLWIDGNKLFTYATSANYGGQPRYGIAILNKNDGSYINEMKFGASRLSPNAQSKITGSSSLKKIFFTQFSSLNFIKGKGYGMNYGILSYSSHPSENIVAATSLQTITTDMNYDFGSDVGVDINLTGVGMSRQINVERYTDQSPNISGVNENYKSNYRFVIFEPDGRGNPLRYTNAEIRFNINEIPMNGIGNASQVKIYHRNSIGYGPFFDCGTVTVSGSELRINTTAFGEFMFASNDASNSLGLITAKANGNWNDATTWDPQIVPDATSNVSIPNTYTVTLTGNQTVNNLGIILGGKVNLNGNQLTINGALMSNGFFTGSPTSTLVFNGTGDAGTLMMDQTNASTKSLGNLTLNKTVEGNLSIGNTLNMNNTLTISNGILTTLGNVVLLSNVSYTARISDITNGGTISGNITVQRFIKGGTNHRRWRFLSSPISGVSFADSWQHDIHITGNGTGGTPCSNSSATNLTQHTNGFDATSTNSSSLKMYDETTGTWAELTSTINNNLTPGIGYLTFVRGDRNTQGCSLLAGTLNTNSDDVTLRATGTVFTGQKNISLTFSGSTNGNGWQLVGNPYPSAIDWNNTTWSAARNSNINSTIYVWEPVSNGYSSWHPVAGGVNGGSNIIASGQAFFVKTDAAATLTFEEGYKVTNNNSGLFGKTSTQNILSIKLSDSIFIDEAKIYMNANATHAKDNFYDGEKLGYTVNNLASFTIKDSTKLTFNGIEFLGAKMADTIPLIAYLTSNKSNYSFTFNGVNSFSGITVLLHDKFLNTTSSITSISTYSFATTTNANSFNAYRFEIIFANPSSLPVELLAFTAEKINEDVLVKWTTANEINNNYFEVERATNLDVNFITIGNVKGQVNSNIVINYSLLDKQIITPTNRNINKLFYRLKQVDFNGSFIYSNIIIIDLKNTILTDENAISLFPVPANDVLNIELKNKYEMISTIEIADVFGKKVFASTLNNTSRINTSQLSTGVYVLTLKTNTHTYQTKFMKQ